MWHNDYLPGIYIAVIANNLEVIYTLIEDYIHYMQILDIILWKGLEHLKILISVGDLEKISNHLLVST